MEWQNLETFKAHVDHLQWDRKKHKFLLWSKDVSNVILDTTFFPCHCWLLFYLRFVESCCVGLACCVILMLVNPCPGNMYKNPLVLKLFDPSWKGISQNCGGQEIVAAKCFQELLLYHSDVKNFISIWTLAWACLQDMHLYYFISCPYFIEGSTFNLKFYFVPHLLI